MSKKNNTVITPKQKSIIAESLQIEQKKAADVGELGYMARVLTQATLPHSEPKKDIFRRSNGHLTVSLADTNNVGLPYGALPRLILAWVTTEAVRTKEKRIILGDTLTSFMEELGIVPTGGRWGSITRLKSQIIRLFGCSIGYKVNDGQKIAMHNTVLASEINLWWDSKAPTQQDIWQSYIDLSHEFFTEITSRPVPIDMRALKALKGSPMALDIYSWLTYRMSYLEKKTYISWEQLQQMFGSNYALNQMGKKNFQRAFTKHLQCVLAVYPQADVVKVRGRLVLNPSPTHIAKK